MSSRARRRIGGLAVVGGAIALRPGTGLHRRVRHGLEVAARRARYGAGRLQGAAYRLQGRQPDPDVSDDILADRIRSSLGTLEKRLDVPRIHVMVEDHVAILHGEVASDHDAEQLVAAVERVSGVATVRSRLHVGLVKSDTRPSEGGQALHAPADR
jgi:hypothetical protein